MNCLPEDAIKIKVENATVPFYKYTHEDETFIVFDSSKCVHPEPMTNAMAGLQLLEKCEKLVMFNNKPPLGLFEKVKDDFNYKVSENVDGTAKIIFTKKHSNSTTTDFTDTKCGGGSCSN